VENLNDTNLSPSPPFPKEENINLVPKIDPNIREITSIILSNLLQIINDLTRDLDETVTKLIKITIRTIEMTRTNRMILVIAARLKTAKFVIMMTLMTIKIILVTVIPTTTTIAMMMTMMTMKLISIKISINSIRIKPKISTIHKS